MLDVLYNHMILATISNNLKNELRWVVTPRLIFFNQWKFIVCSQWPMNKNVKLVEIKSRWFE